MEKRKTVRGKREGGGAGAASVRFALNPLSRARGLFARGDFEGMLVIAPCVSATSAVLGIYLSYWLNASPGGLVVLVHAAVFALAYLLSPAHGVLGSRLAARRRRRAVAG